MIFVNPFVLFPKPIQTQPVITPSSLLNGLISYWNFNDTSTDLVGSNNGSNISITYVPGKIGDAIGGYGYVNVGSANLNLLDLSISCWIKLSSFSNYYFIISRLVNNGAYQNTYEIRVNPSGYIEVLTTAPGAIVSTNPLSTGVWTYLSVTRDSGGITKIYLNGTEVGNGTLAPPTSLPSQDTLIGSREDFYTQLNNVLQIDELGVWNRLLTSGEVTQLYNSGTGLSYPF